MPASVAVGAHIVIASFGGRPVATEQSGTGGRSEGGRSKGSRSKGGRRQFMVGNL